jgi:hypothetical protein
MWLRIGYVYESIATYLWVHGGLERLERVAHIQVESDERLA